jgi:hypothetical protein
MEGALVSQELNIAHAPLTGICGYDDIGQQGRIVASCLFSRTAQRRPTGVIRIDILWRCISAVQRSASKASSIRFSGHSIAKKKKKKNDGIARRLEI